MSTTVIQITRCTSGCHGDNLGNTRGHEVVTKTTHYCQYITQSWYSTWHNEHTRITNIILDTKLPRQNNITRNFSIFSNENFTRSVFWYTLSGSLWNSFGSKGTDWCLLNLFPNYWTNIGPYFLAPITLEYGYMQMIFLSYILIINMFIKLESWNICGSWS